MGKIVYLAHYCTPESGDAGSPAAVGVMDYVIGSLNKTGHEVTVISPIQRMTGKRGKREVIRLHEKTVCIFTPRLRRAKPFNIPFRALQKYRRERNLRKELERTVHDGDTLLVYHSLALMGAVRSICKKRKVTLILQVCELYTDAEKVISQRRRKKERTYITMADRYIFMSETLARQLGQGKDCAVCHGVYQARSISPKDNRKEIHVVYAGTLSRTKGGAEAAIRAAGYLGEGYHVHILGFGSGKEVDETRKQIREVSRSTRARVTYEGVLYGEDYLRFLQRCDIGLSTQDPGGEYNATSFPSKILSYLSNGLRVVSSRNPVVEASEVARCLYYYEEQEPEAIAKAIMSIDLNRPYDTREIIEALDRAFCEKLKELCKPTEDKMNS